MSTDEKNAHTTKGVVYGTISLVCVSSCYWTAAPQRVVFHQHCDHRRLEAWPCLPQKAHSHTTKYSQHNQPSQPLSFLYLREKYTDTWTHLQTYTLTFICKCSHQYKLAWIRTNTHKVPCVSVHTHTNTLANHKITPLQSCAERGR